MIDVKIIRLGDGRIFARMSFGEEAAQRRPLAEYRGEAAKFQQVVIAWRCGLPIMDDGQARRHVLHQGLRQMMGEMEKRQRAVRRLWLARERPHVAAVRGGPM